MNRKSKSAKMSNRIFNELLRCEKERLILVEIALKHGLGDPRTIAQSEKVDRFLNRVMKKDVVNVPPRHV